VNETRRSLAADEATEHTEHTEKKGAQRHPRAFTLLITLGRQILQSRRFSF
jgi:hypothetical protein